MASVVDPSYYIPFNPGRIRQGENLHNDQNEISLSEVLQRIWLYKIDNISTLHRMVRIHTHGDETFKPSIGPLLSATNTPNI